MKPVMQKIKGKIWVHINGKTIALEEQSKNFTAGRSKKKNSGELLAPMPGRITKLLKQLNDQVETGEVVLMMEAMKMEYSLKAEGKGVIAALHCQVGDQVTLGKLLVKINAEVEND